MGNKKDINLTEQQFKEMKNYLNNLAKKSNYDYPVMMMIQNSLSDILDDYIPII
ncbi:MAG: hypothetical protein IKG35_05050 [Erysipelotrichaceae bacterium]|nr:hypothetical protein [Erysipelotrichaceae bacterium]MBR3351465.1 hypothetical protein [Erysipelotrichaceae bacterium]